MEPLPKGISISYSFPPCLRSQEKLFYCFKIRFFSRTLLTFFLISFFFKAIFADEFYIWMDIQGVRNVSTKPPPSNKFASWEKIPEEILFSEPEIDKPNPDLVKKAELLFKIKENPKKISRPEIPIPNTTQVETKEPQKKKAINTSQSLIQNQDGTKKIRIKEKREMIRVPFSFDLIGWETQTELAGGYTPNSSAYRFVLVNLKVSRLPWNEKSPPPEILVQLKNEKGQKFQRDLVGEQKIKGGINYKYLQGPYVGRSFKLVFKCPYSASSELEIAIKGFEKKFNLPLMPILDQGRKRGYSKNPGEIAEMPPNGLRFTGTSPTITHFFQLPPQKSLQFTFNSTGPIEIFLLSEDERYKKPLANEGPKARKKFSFSVQDSQNYRLQVNSKGLWGIRIAE